MKPEISIPLHKAHDITPAVLRAGEYCREAGCSENDGRLISTAVSELANNIIKYARHGSIRMKEVQSNTRHGIEVVAIDSGPGISDVGRAMKDHYSSSGTLGLGLPGIKRMMDDFDIQSTRGEGTRIVARKWI
ncbi:MAG TPA: ATP-binding protein [Gammaproteobacteria bacterium]|nr:ATP-binding protein [Gammaproteobacteria bacterium]